MNQLLYALGIVVIPLIPALLLYWLLPSKTQVKGPFKGLNLNLQGAFAGYFLVLLLCSGLFLRLLGDEQQKEINQLRAQVAGLKQERSSQQAWIMHGNVVSTSPKETKIFFDERDFSSYDTGDFELKFSCAFANGTAELPRAVCIFNRRDGYKVINLNRRLNTKDIVDYDIRFDDSLQQITINKSIDIQSKKRDSVRITTNLVRAVRAKRINLEALRPTPAQ